MRVNQFKQRVDPLLRQCVDDLAMTLGVLASIDSGSYEIVAVYSNSGAYVAGEKYSLGNGFCREVFEQQKTLASTLIDNDPLTLHHPLYRSLPLECYLGVPIVVDGRPWGCVDFSSMAQRDEAFSEDEINRVERIAAEIGVLIGEFDRSQAARVSAGSSAP